LNFYKHYIGDYQRDTGHLSLAEHGAYRLMLDTFYATEKPLPTDRKSLYRLLRADGPAERKAIDVIASEFWTETESGLVNERANSEIEKAEKQADANRQIAITREARKRQRLEHDSSHEASDENSTIRATNGSTNAEPNHSHSHSQTLTSKALSSAPDSSAEYPANAEAAPLRNAEIAKLLRSQGIDATSQHPLICLDWAINPKITDEVLQLAVDKAKRQKPGQRIPVNYLKNIVADELNPPPAVSKPSEDWTWKKSDAGITRKGQELGVPTRGGESYRDYADRIQAEIDKRKAKGQPA
jgi:uncharacterized protein YdaU (DUF1376 family)